MGDKGPVEEVEELRKRGDFDSLLGILRYREDSETRVAAMHALLDIDPVKAADAILDFATDENRMISRNSLKILAEQGDLRCLPFIELLANSGEESDRELAVELLRKIRKPEVVRLLLDLVDDAVEDIWDAAYEAILEMGEIAVPALIEAMHDVIRRINAAELLGMLHNEKVEAELLARWKDSEEYDRYYIMRALRFRSSPEVVEFAGSSLSDDCVATRKEAAEYLARQKSGRALELLGHALRDTDAEVRLIAAEALAEKADNDVVVCLQALVDHDDRKIRSRAIVALARAMGGEAMPFVKKSLNDSNKYVRSAAIKALSGLGTPEAVRELLLATEDPYELVRNEAKKSLKDMGRGFVENALSAFSDKGALLGKVEDLFG